ncbi:MAG: META domain-containing protein [Pseudomonadota bacterium]
MSRLVLLFATLFLSACTDETISGFVDTEATYRLTSIDGIAFDAPATIAFRKQGRATGTAPCNNWSADQLVPYPWFELGPVAATKRACPDLDKEQQFFQALSEMTLAEISGAVLILSNDDGREMEFKAQTH